MSVRIVSFNPKYSRHFKDLNTAWLNTYFYVEPKDILLLENCEESIINNGGFIFFAEYDGEIVGCFSFIKLGDSCYELGKMAVDPNYQGLRIGQHMMQFAIGFAQNENWKKIILYSNTKLDTALHIYRKYGFKEIVLEKELPYARSDIKMELTMND